MTQRKLLLPSSGWLNLVQADYPETEGLYYTGMLHGLSLIKATKREEGIDLLLSQ
jgi:hypothetical protein